MNIDVRQDAYGRVTVMIDGRKLRRWRTSSRDVYLDVQLGVVVKVDNETLDNRYKQCKAEIRNWKRFNEEQRAYVSPLLAHGSVRGGRDRKWVAHERVFGRRPTTEQYYKYGVHFVFWYLGLRDDQEKNVLITKDGPVVVDYGV